MSPSSSGRTATCGVAMTSATGARRLVSVSGVGDRDWTAVGISGERAAAGHSTDGYDRPPDIAYTSAIHSTLKVSKT